MVRVDSKMVFSGVPRLGDGERHRAFTLIELLVVIAVIALLLAILMPALRAAKSVAKRVGCQSNLKQIALAWNMYLQDHDGRFYQCEDANLNYGGWCGMIGLAPRPLNSYFGLPVDLETESNARVYCCPADRGGVPGFAWREKAYHYLGTSYYTNIMLIGPDQVLVLNDKFKTLHEEINKRLKDLKINHVANASRLLLVGDYGWLNQWRAAPHPRQDWKELAEWHGREDHFSMAFLDGHTAFLEIRKGYYVTDEYCVLPFQELYDLACEVQGPLP